jgi:hypothetical protein
LDPEKSILESLKGMTFIEYPTIHVVDQILENWTIESPQ